MILLKINKTSFHSFNIEGYYFPAILYLCLQVDFFHWFCVLPSLPLVAVGMSLPRKQKQRVAPKIEPRILTSERNAYFGDLHVHTKHSFDAYIFGVIGTPDDAYNYAKGESVQHPLGYEMKLKAPLDFFAVTDHGIFMGMLEPYSDTAYLNDNSIENRTFENLNQPENLTKETGVRRLNMFGDIALLLTGPDSTSIWGIVKAFLNDHRALALSNFDDDVHKSAWRDIVESAERHYEPGVLTTFVAYEYTASTFDRGNLHRNVIFSGSTVPDRPFSRIDSSNPEDLWAWMDGLRDQGIDSLAIPHNSNGSNGQMFRMEDWAGNPMGEEYASLRMRNEPVVEITQVKGTSDTHPLLSPYDEWADFEISESRVGTTLYSQINGSYVREAYLRGLIMEQERNANPYKFGLIGSSDSHLASSSTDEDNFFSKVGILDGIPEFRGSIPLTDQTRQETEEWEDLPGNEDEYMPLQFIQWSASGLAGVWAEENTREAIFASFRRKETFATSGPRIKIRLFGGYSLQASMLNQPDIIKKVYKEATPMGGDLPNSDNSGKSPGFLVWAEGDAMSAPLQRLQIIKGWTDINGKPQEKIYDVACSGGYDAG